MICKNSFLAEISPCVTRNSNWKIRTY